MRKSLIGAVVLQAGVCLSVTGAAQAQDKPAETFTYATYYVCDVVQQERSDEIYKTLNQPFMDAAVADGSLSAYGLYAHQTGGRWRRVSFSVAPSIQALLDAQKKIGDQMDAKDKGGKLDDEYGKICNSHDDYIWRRVGGNAGTTSPGGAVFSTYYVCDSREAQADAIAMQIFAPILDKIVAEGKLKTWGYMEHIVGGQFRRLETLGAADVKSLMEARAEINDALTDNPLGDLFTEICDSHADYIWEVKASGNR